MKTALICIIVGLTLYPVAELSRVIILYNRAYPDWQFMAELVIMWVLYLSMIPVLRRFINVKS